jgi:hypothetical protein
LAAEGSPRTERQEKLSKVRLVVEVWRQPHETT